MAISRAYRPAEGGERACNSRTASTEGEMLNLEPRFEWYNVRVRHNAPMHVQPITLQDIYYLLLRHWMLPAFIQIKKSGIFSKNGFSYEYHYDFNQLTALYLKMLAPKGRLSLHSKDDCIVRLWLRCDGCDFTLQTIHSIYLVKYPS